MGDDELLGLIIHYPFWMHNHKFYGRYILSVSYRQRTYRSC